MKKVHDIFVGNRTTWDGERAVVAFIQHGDKGGGFLYENVCPWCGHSIEMVSANPDAEMSTVLKRLQQGMSDHITVCPRRGSHNMLVEKTTEPLNTIKVVKIM